MDRDKMTQVLLKGAKMVSDKMPVAAKIVYNVKESDNVSLEQRNAVKQHFEVQGFEVIGSDKIIHNKRKKQ